MKIYIALCEDRHFDPVVRVFDTAKKAIDYAKKFVQEYARHSENITESNIEGWLYYCTFSCDGDCVHVEEGELNKNEYIHNYFHK